MSATRRLGRHLISIYLAIDPRTLGLFRIVLGCVLLFDVLRRIPDVDYWYTEEGLFPAHLVRTSRVPYLVSFFFYLSSRGEALGGMALCVLIYLIFTVGYRTRLFHLLSLLCLVSLNNRIFILENGGQFVLTALCVWSLFLPLGRRFSMDALLASARARERGSEPAEPDDRPVIGLAVLALLLQFAVLYYLNVVQKTGELWKDGSAVYYALADERMVTIFGVWFRELPYPALQWLAWGTLWVESYAVVAILSPIFSRHLRLLAILLLPGLHLGFTLCLEIGVFSWAMISFFTLLVARRHWEWLERLRRRREWPNPGRALAERAARSGAIRILARWDPGGRLGAVGVLRWSAVGIREVAVLVVMAACVGDLVNSNPAFARYRYPQPEFLNAVIWYPRMRQYWRMFAPQPPQSMVALAVEARTRDGRVVDPYNEVASRYEKIDRRTMPVRLGQDQFFSDYTKRIPGREFVSCHNALGNWIINYPDRTGNPDDEIVSYRVYEVRKKIPPPGTEDPNRISWRSFMML